MRAPAPQPKIHPGRQRTALRLRRMKELARHEIIDATVNKEIEQ